MANENKRTFLFSLSDDERRDTKKLCSFAMRVPAIGKVASKFEEDDLKVQRKNLQKVINTCWRHPGILMQAVDWVEEKAQELADRGSAQMFENISNLRALDEQWAVQFLVKKGGFQITTLEKACENDGDSWRQLFVYGMVASLSLKIPKAGKDKLVCSTWIERRLSVCGKRFQHMTGTTLLNKDGLIDWGKHGVYSLEFDGNRCTKIHHKPSGASYTCEEHVVITKKFQIQENWSDFGARIVCRPTEYNIAEDFFTKDPAQGPHLLMHWTAACWAAENAMKEAKATVDEGRNNEVGVGSTGEGEFMKSQKAAAKKKYMESARKALESKQKDINNRRSVKFE